MPFVYTCHWSDRETPNSTQDITSAFEKNIASNKKQRKHNQVDLTVGSFGEPARCRSSHPLRKKNFWNK